MKIFAKDYGVNVGESVGKTLNKLLRDVSKLDEPSEIILEKGTYYIDSEDIEPRVVYITNTIGRREWKKGEQYQQKRIAITIENVKDLTIEGNGAKFILRGVMTNMMIAKSEKVVIKDITIDVEKPNLHELKVIAVGKHSFDFEIDSNSNYVKKGMKYYFVGKDYEYDLCENRRWSWWTGLVKADTPNTIKRVAHPLATTIKLRELSHGKFRAYTLIKPSQKLGSRYYIFDVRRKDVGIFIDRSKDIVLDGVEQNFNYALAIVAQDTENITLDNLRLMPSADSDMKMCAIADFIHLCMCRGYIKVRGGSFIGAGDDCLNVHGIHFQIASIEGNKIVVRFMHPQAYGFNPLRVGDSIEFVNRATLLPCGNAKIMASRMLDEYSIELTLDDASSAEIKGVIEDVSALPYLLFENNYMTRIITRGILVTTRNADIIGNNFDSCSMHSILFSDDANNWYESGRVDRAVISNNTFGYTPMYNVYIKPEITHYAGSVHGEFIIENNKFNTDGAGGIYALATKSVELRDNESKAPIRIDTKEVENIIK